jgi:4-hydroxybenzoate polyprenyltransferase
VVVTSLTVVFGGAVGLSASRLFLVGAAVLSGQLTIGWLNDLHDRSDDVAAGRTDKPLATGVVSPRVVRIALAVALTALLAFSIALGPLAGLLNLIVAGAGWAYDLRLKSTVWSWIPYAVAFGLLPAVVVGSLPAPAPAPPWWACAAGALLGIGAHAANALPDIDDDRSLGTGGLPARLGASGTRVLAVISLAVATALLVLAPSGGPGVLGWVAVALAALLLVAGLGRRWPEASRAPFVIVATLAVADVLLLVARAGSWVPTG